LKGLELSKYKRFCSLERSWKYLNINDSFHLKDLEISKYKRESKTRMDS
jgi:hypothetical protein